MAVVIFRQYNDALDQVRANLYADLQAGRLRQGWGYVGNGASMTLLDAEGVQVPRPAWEANYQQARPDWGHPGKRYTILERMLQLDLNNVVIVPKMPADTAFSVACVAGYYDFETPAWSNDFGHIISVNPDSVKTYPNHHDPDTDVIAGIIRGAPFMSAVNIAVNTPTRAYLDELHAALVGLGFECPA